MNELVITTAITIFIIIAELIKAGPIEDYQHQDEYLQKENPERTDFYLGDEDSLEQVCAFLAKQDEERRQNFTFVHVYHKLNATDEEKKQNFNVKPKEEQKTEWVNSCIVWLGQYHNAVVDEYGDLAKLFYMAQNDRQSKKYKNNLRKTNAPTLGFYKDMDDGYVNTRQLRTEYEITHPNYTFNGTWSPAREYEWEKTEVPSVTPSLTPSLNPSSFPTKKRKPTKKPSKKPTPKKVTRRPTPKPSKKPTKRKRPNNYPTDAPDGRNGGIIESQTCHNGCLFARFNGQCDDCGIGSVTCLCPRGSDCFDW